MWIVFVFQNNGNKRVKKNSMFMFFALQILHICHIWIEPTTMNWRYLCVLANKINYKRNYCNILVVVPIVELCLCIQKYQIQSKRVQ